MFNTHPKQKGSITLEYVLVSLFTLALSLGSLAMVKKLILSDIEPLLQEHGLSVEETGFSDLINSH